MGTVHIGEDKEVDREEIRRTDKILNEHSTAWCGIWGTGRGHSQEDRVLLIKVSKSENRVKLYLSIRKKKKKRDQLEQQIRVTQEPLLTLCLTEQRQTPKRRSMK